MGETLSKCTQCNQCSGIFESEADKRKRAMQHIMQELQESAATQPSIRESESAAANPKRDVLLDAKTIQLLCTMEFRPLIIDDHSNSTTRSPLPDLPEGRFSDASIRQVAAAGVHDVDVLSAISSNEAQEKKEDSETDEANKDKLATDSGQPRFHACSQSLPHIANRKRKLRAPLFRSNTKTSCEFDQIDDLQTDMQQKLVVLCPKITLPTTESSQKLRPKRILNLMGVTSRYNWDEEGIDDHHEQMAKEIYILTEMQQHDPVAMKGASQSIDPEAFRRVLHENKDHDDDDEDDLESSYISLSESERNEIQSRDSSSAQ